jgi:pilus assembly protein FimV
MPVGSSHSPSTLQPADEPPRELSVEELIDLEQQAEFFVVLGQDDAAIDLLMSHVRSDGGISPLPYLKLLEIYRRRGEEEAYQRIRERFNRRFNAYAPDWDSDLQLGRSLPDYPDIIERLQGLWATPARVMETLDASLFRRNNSDETFDLPAYRELLFLYSVARDLAEHGGKAPTMDVDLLLPLDPDGTSNVSRLMATRVMPKFEHSEMATMPLDLDVSFDVGAREYEGASRIAATRAPAEAAPKSMVDSHFLEFDEDLPVTPIKPAGKA